MCFAHSPRASGAEGNLLLRELRILPEAFCAMEIRGISYCKEKTGLSQTILTRFVTALFSNKNVKRKETDYDFSS